MFTKRVRNERLLAAVKRDVAAQIGKQAAERAIAKAERTAAEIKWLIDSPVKDGKAGEDLPTEEELAQVREAEEARLRRSRKRPTKNAPADQDNQQPVYDDDGNVI